MKEYRNILMAALSFMLLLAVSCSNEGTTGGGGEGGGAGGGAGGGGSGGQGGSGYPSWYLTEAQQQQNFSMGPTILFDTTGATATTGQKYRIPAIIVADNGNIVALTDDRKSHGGDIGAVQGLIDIVYKISKDGGKTWGDKKIIPPISSDYSYSKALNKGDVLVFKALDGTLVCMAVSGGGFANATANTPSRIVRSESKDHGETWTAWQEVGEDLINNIKSDSDVEGPKAFASSGRGLTLKDGTFAAAMLVQGKGKNIAAYIYSKDLGKTWTLGGWIKNYPSGNLLNEPKVIAELDDGKLLMSIRNHNNGGQMKTRMYAISETPVSAGATTWPTSASLWSFKCGNVDAEGVVWTRKSDGADKTRIINIQAGPTSGSTHRKGLKFYVFDAANLTQHYKDYVILQESVGAAYSSIDVLGDGTIITLAEEHSDNGQYYDIVFRRYNMKAITGEVYKTEWYKPIKN